MPMTTPDAALYRLAAWLSPSFPVGAYTYSHGLEHAVEAGLVHNRSSLEAWVEAVIRHGSGRLDAMLLAAAHRTAASDLWPELLAVFERAAAHRGSAELAVESTDQGHAFLATAFAAWPDPRVDRLQAELRQQETLPSYAAGVGAVAVWSDIALDVTLALFLQAFAANLISAGVRLIPLGQTDGQRIVAALEAPVLEAARAAALAPLETMGTATPMVDLACMRHETQYTRLFRS